MSAVPQAKTPDRVREFFWDHLKPYVGWAVLALVGILLFAAATAAVVSLIKPVFAEVLLAGDSTPDPLAGLTGGAVGGHGAPASAHGKSTTLDNLKKKLNVAGQLDSAYA